MSNSRSDLALGTLLIDLKKPEEALGSLYDLLTVDNDLTENEDYFQEDTLELGYDCEADRIWTEKTKDKKFNTIDEFEDIFLDVWSAITSQEYYGDSEYEIVDIGDDKYVIAYCYGGYNQW
jgi:hypothetical protein